MLEKDLAYKLPLSTGDDMESLLLNQSRFYYNGQLIKLGNNLSEAVRTRKIVQIANNTGAAMKDDVDYDTNKGFFSKSYKNKAFNRGSYSRKA